MPPPLAQGRLTGRRGRLLEATASRTAPRSGLRSDQGIAPYAETVSLRSGDRRVWRGNPELSSGRLPPSSSLRETLDDTSLREGGNTPSRRLRAKGTRRDTPKTLREGRLTGRRRPLRCGTIRRRGSAGDQRSPLRRGRDGGARRREGQAPPLRQRIDVGANCGPPRASAPTVETDVDADRRATKGRPYGVDETAVRDGGRGKPLPYGRELTLARIAGRRGRRPLRWGRTLTRIGGPPRASAPTARDGRSKRIATQVTSVTAELGSSQTSLVRRRQAWFVARFSRVAMFLARRDVSRASRCFSRVAMFLARRYVSRASRCSQ